MALTSCATETGARDGTGSAAGVGGAAPPIAGNAGMTPVTAGASGGAGSAGAAGLPGSASAGGGGSGMQTTPTPVAGASGQAGAIAGSSGSAAASMDAGVPSSACDRACLLEVLSDYLDALAARDPSSLPVASTLKYTDNGEVAQLGEGLWTTASALVPAQRLDFADPETGQVASQLTIHENGTSPVIYQVRLKVEAREITEIESMTVRQLGARNGFFMPDNMQPQPVFLQAIDPRTRMTRDQLKSEVDIYLEYLAGDASAADLHLDDGCARYENGVRTANGPASFALQSWSFDVSARYLVFDEEAGIAWGMFPFAQTDTALVVGEAFKVIDGKIMMIQAVMADIPAKSWD